MNDSDVVAEFFHFAHDVGGEHDRLAVVAAFADEAGDRAGGHDIQAHVGSSKIITEGSWTRVRAMETFCFIPVESLSQRRSRKSFISRRSKIVHDAAAQSGFIETVQAAEIFNHLLRGKAAVKRGGRGEKSHAARTCADSRTSYPATWRCPRARESWRACARWWFFRRRWHRAGRRFLPAGN